MRIIKRMALMLMILPLLGINRLIILMVPFRHIASRLGRQMYEPTVVINKTHEGRVLFLGNTIRLLSAKTPWESKCFVQSLTAMETMKVFRIPGTVYFGIRKKKDE